MAPQPNEHCENCLKYFKRLHRCAGCGLIRYCSKACQKAHWKTHKFYCHANVAVRERAEQMSPYHGHRQKSLEVWCEKNSQFIGVAGLSALNIMQDRERSESFVFIVYLDVRDSDTPSGTTASFTYSIRTARCIPLARVHEMFDHTVKGGHTTIERSLAPRPRMLRIFVVDDFPGMQLYTLPTDVPDDVKEWHYRSDWLARLKIDVLRKERILKRL